MINSKRSIIHACNLSLRKLATVAVKSSQLSELNRKDIIPLFKYLHPDLLMDYSNDIKSANMSCIQNINDLWDTLQINLDGFNKKDAIDCSIIKILSQRKLVDIQHPFRESYDLTCYLERYLNTNPNNVRDTKSNVHELHKCIIKIPESLCKKQSISFEIFQTSIKTILIQHGKLFELAGLTNPWQLYYPNHPHHHTKEQILKSQTTATATFKSFNKKFMNCNHNSSSRISNSSIDGDLGELESRLFDKWMIKNNQHSLTNSLNSKNLQSIFGNNQITKRTKSDGMLLNTEIIDLYLKNGKVMITPMDATEEFKAVKHLRSFLIDYADVLNFTLDRWQFVTFILHRHNKNSDNLKQPINTNKDQDKDIMNEKDLYQSKGFKIEQKEKYFIVTVPHLFKIKIILEFLGKYLPHAKLSL